MQQMQPGTATVAKVVDGEARMPVNHWLDYASKANKHFNATRSVREHADLMIEEAISKLSAESDEYVADEYERSYLQGKKDALRVILLCLEGV